MRSKNILLKELFKRKYRNRIKQSKKGKGSFKRLKKIKVEDWKKEREKKKVKERRKVEMLLLLDKGFFVSFALNIGLELF